MASKGKLLVVSSEHMVGMLLGNYLKGLGYELEMVADALEMLGLLVEWQPEVIVCLQIAHDEHTVTKTLSSASIDIPVLMLAPEEELEACRNQSVVAALPWPSPRPLVGKTIERILTQRRASKLVVQPTELQIRDTDPAPPLDEDHPPSQYISRYRIEALIGRGGMGDVYRCHDDLDIRMVAVKTIRCPIGTDNWDEDPKIKRFEVEYAALSRLNHPRIVAHHNFGKDLRRGEMFLVMQFVDGPSLRHLLDKGELPIEEAVRIGWELGDALAHAHERGIVHRDVKPENVLINELGQPMLTDFGLARLLFFDNYSVSGGKVIAGTPAYMAPEQILSPADVDARTDQFCLGAVMHEMLTGSESVSKGNDHKANILARLEVTFPTLAEVGVEAPESLQEILTRMLQREPDDRFQSDEELLDAFIAAGVDLDLDLERL